MTGENRRGTREMHKFFLRLCPAGPAFYGKKGCGIVRHTL